MTTANGKSGKLKRMVFAGVFATLIAVCSWISVPVAIPFTLQTFGVFSALLLLGGVWGTVSICVYLALGAAGLPVFSGFSGGLGHFFGSTGGYLLGFILMGIVYIILEKAVGSSNIVRITALSIGLILCYALGTYMFMRFYGINASEGFSAAVTACVLPYVLPDGAKLFLAIILAKKINKPFRSILGK